MVFTNSPFQAERFMMDLMEIHPSHQQRPLDDRWRVSGVAAAVPVAAIARRLSRLGVCGEVKS